MAENDAYQWSVNHPAPWLTADGPITHLPALRHITVECMAFAQQLCSSTVQQVELLGCGGACMMVRPAPPHDCEPANASSLREPAAKKVYMARSSAL